MSLLRTATEAANDMNERQLILLLRAVALILEERAGGEKAKEVLRIIGSDMRAPDTASPGEATREGT